MGPATRLQPVLTTEEWDILIELLERERADLPPEIRHTSTGAIREALHRRLDLIENLLKRLSPVR